MTLEFSSPQILIKKPATVVDIFDAKRGKDEIYYNGKLLPENFDIVYKETLIDYAAISLIKESDSIEELITVENEVDHMYLKSLSYEFGVDLRKLSEKEEYKKMLMSNHLALQLMAASRITSAKYDDLMIELINGLDSFKEIIEKIESNITPSY